MKNEAKFTKGPWVVEATGPHWNNPELRNIEIQHGDIGECVADTVYMIEDAHLIAAAPEMYEEIRAFHKLILEASETGFDINNGDFGQASYLQAKENDTDY